MILIQKRLLTHYWRKEVQTSAKPWLTKEILKSIQIKNALYNNVIKGFNNGWKIQKILQQIDHYKENCQKNYSATLIETNKRDLSKQWQLMRELPTFKNKLKTYFFRLEFGDDEKPF